MKLSERALLKLVKAKDDAALVELCQRYAPLIMKIKRHYYLREFDDDDWDQEAMLVCYETACLFDAQRNPNFGAFYKMRLTNHARSLLRYEYAQRRAPYAKAASYESALEAGLVHEPSVEPLAWTDLSADYDRYLQKLSPRELTALRLYLHLPAAGQDYSSDQLAQARQRCKKKLKLALLQGD